MKSFTVTKYEEGLSLKKYIKERINANKTFLIMMERKKLIRLNGMHPKDYDIVLKENDVVSFYVNDSYFIVHQTKPNFDIVYEDENIIIIDKDAGVLTHGIGDNHNSLIDYVSKYLENKGEYIPSLATSFKPQISTRLDTNTKGLLIVSKNKETLSLINKLISDRLIIKKYLTIVKGKFKEKEGILKDYIEIDDKKSIVKVFKDKSENRKEIITAYKVIKEYDDYEVLEIELITGRTHQIRSHLAFYNHPVLGDNKYGDKNLNKKLNLASQELISYNLTFNSNDLKHLDYLKNKSFFSKKKFKLINK
ncbi:RluA family pseudouridine synthase [bacterium]|nr:RluA family pseudouridine synthase [bacterium]